MVLRGCALWCVLIGAAGADPQGGPGRGPGPAFLRELFPPQFVIQHQGDLDLTGAQRQAIAKEMVALQSEIAGLRRQIDEKAAALDALLAKATVDEAAALAQADELAKLEQRLKRVRLGVMIRVKNQLTPAQQQTLKRLLPPATARERRGGGGPPKPGPGANG